MPKRMETGLTWTSNRKNLALGTALGAPTQTAPSTSTTGGTGLAAATTYYYVVTALNALGQTIKSNEQSILTGAGTTNSNTVNWNAVSGATGYRIYRGTAAGAEGVYYQVGAVTTYVDTGAASTAGTPPTVDSTNFYQPGTVVPNALLAVLRRLDMLISRRFVYPNTELYAKPPKSGTGTRLQKPKPSHANSKERANF